VETLLFFDDGGVNDTIEAEDLSRGDLSHSLLTDDVALFLKIYHTNYN